MIDKDYELFPACPTCGQYSAVTCSNGYHVAVNDILPKIFNTILHITGAQEDGAWNVSQFRWEHYLLPIADELRKLAGANDE